GIRDWSVTGVQTCALPIFADLATEGGHATVADIEQLGGRAIFVQTDVSRAEDTRRLAEAALEAYGQIDVLVNNAAIGGGDDILEIGRASCRERGEVEAVAG